MGVLRELVAVFRVDYDRTGARQADRDLNRLKGAARATGNGLAGLASAGAAASRVLGAVGLAFGAHEAEQRWRAAEAGVSAEAWGRP